MAKNPFSGWSMKDVEAHNARIESARSRGLHLMGDPDYNCVLVKPPTIYSIPPFHPGPVLWRESDHEVSRRMFNVKIVPMGAVRCNRSVRWKKSPAQERYFAYKDQLRAQVGTVQCPHEVNITALIPMPATWSKKKQREMIGRPHQQRADADNIFKGVADALWPEDKSIFSQSCKKFWCKPGDEELAIEMKWFSLKKQTKP